MVADGCGLMHVRAHDRHGADLRAERLGGGGGCGRLTLCCGCKQEMMWGKI